MFFVCAWLLPSPVFTAKEGVTLKYTGLEKPISEKICIDLVSNLMFLSAQII